MTLDRRLKELFDLIRDEARQNAAFGERLTALLGEGSWSVSAPEPAEIKRGNRRPKAIVDPVTEIQHGEPRLRELLAPLDLEQLRDVVAEYRMDPSKLVMKWKDRERVVDHIITTATSRGRKGDAFRA